MQSLYTLKPKQLDHILEKLELKKANQSRIFSKIFRTSPYLLKENSQISSKLIDYLESNFSFDLETVGKIDTVHESEDGTVKFLIQFSDKQKVESVAIPFWKKYTICLSSQVGCAMGCTFCHTATQGFMRNLSSEQIVAQYMLVRNWLKQKDSRPLKNIVFMGQGEPLHNFDNVKEAIGVFMNTEGLSIGKSNITVSTSGHLAGLLRFHELQGVNLALSLHSLKNDVRSKLIPLNRKYPFEEILNCIDELYQDEQKHVEYEYLLIDGVNDTQEDIDLLKKYVGVRPHLINIIPFNPYPGSEFKRPSEDKIKWFLSSLQSLGLRTMRRQTKGDDILAACGQLKSASKNGQ